LGKIIHYLKPYCLVLLACIVLLFGQAFCDLNLPNLMSDIVNVGIQQGGVQDKAPKAITQDDMQFIATFMTPAQNQVMQADYVLTDSEQSDVSGKPVKDAYPASLSAPVWLRLDQTANPPTTFDNAAQDQLNDAFGSGVWGMIKLFGEVKDANDQGKLKKLIGDPISDAIKKPMSDYISDHIKQPMSDYISDHIKQPLSDYISSHIKKPMSDYISSHLKKPLADYVSAHLKKPLAAYEQAQAKAAITKIVKAKVPKLVPTLVPQYMAQGMSQADAVKAATAAAVKQVTAAATKQVAAKMKKQMAALSGSTKSGDSASMQKMLKAIPRAVLKKAGLLWLSDLGNMASGSMSATSKLLDEIPHSVLAKANLLWLKDFASMSSGSGKVSAETIDQIPTSILRQANLLWLRDFASISSGSGKVSSKLIKGIPSSILKQAKLTWLSDFAAMSDKNTKVSSKLINKIPDSILKKSDLEWLKSFNLNNSDTKTISSDTIKKIPSEILDKAGLSWMTTVDFSSFQSDSVGGFNSDDGNTDITTIDMSKMYSMEHILKLLPQSYFDTAFSQAQTVAPATRTASGTSFTKVFYKDLGMDMTTMELSYILFEGLLMLFATLGSGLCTVLVGLLSARIGTGMARDMRRDIYDKVEGFSNTEFDRFSTASLITRSTNDVMQIQYFVAMGIRMFFYAPILGIGAFIMAVTKSVSMAWIIGVAVLFIIGVLITLMIVVMPKFRIIQNLYDKLNRVAREALGGLMVIRAFGRQKFETDHFKRANRDVYKTNLFVQRSFVFLMPIMMLAMNGISVLIIWIGAKQVAASQMQVGDMMAYLQYAMQVVMGFMFIAMGFIFAPRAVVSAGRIGEVLDTKLMINDPEHPQDFDQAHKGEVEFRAVSFAYEGAEGKALEDISFLAPSGKTTAFIGATGSGKSTVLNLIPRFYDVSAGAVLVEGVDVREVAQHDLRARIGYVPQKSVLMAGTIAENIAYGEDQLSDAEVKKLAEVSQASEFIKGLEGGYDFELSQGGANVSGGQKQRLSIARALAVKPDILLFDDSFSALDMKTDATLRHALRDYAQGTTLLIVAQRVSTIMDADQIIVIDNGRIVGKGTHVQLVRDCPEYHEIAASQLSSEELEESTKGVDE
jgi:ATP-binding cassette subfamily B protein